MPGINIQRIPARMAVLFLVLLSHKTKAAEDINKVDKEYKNGELILRHVSEIPHILEFKAINQAKKGGFE